MMLSLHLSFMSLLVAIAAEEPGGPSRQVELVKKKTAATNADQPRADDQSKPTQKPNEAAPKPATSTTDKPANKSNQPAQDVLRSRLGPTPFMFDEQSGQLMQVFSDAAKPIDLQQSPQGDELRNKVVRAHYVVGLSYLHRRQLNRAFTEFKKALELDPTDMPTLKEFLPITEVVGQHEVGLKFCRQALLKEPDNIPILQFFANRMLRQGKVDQAILALQNATKVTDLRKNKPGAFFSIHWDLLQMAARIKDIPQSVKSASALTELALNPSILPESEGLRQQMKRSTAFYELIAQALATGSKFEQARDVLQYAIASFDIKSIALRTPLAEILLAQKQYDAALAQIQAHHKSSTATGRTYQVGVQILKAMKKSPEEIMAAIKRWEDDENSNEDLSVLAARMYMEQKNFDEARLRLNKLENHKEAQVLLTELYRLENDPRGLLDQLVVIRRGSQERFLRNRIEQPNVEAMEAAIAKDPKLVEAIANFERNDKRERSNIVTATQYSIICELAIKAKLTPLAIEYGDKLLALNSHDEIRNELIQYLRNAEDFPTMTRLAEAGYKIDPNDVQAVVSLSDAYALVGRSEEALTILDKAMKNIPNEDSKFRIRLYRGQVLELGEKWRQAVSEYEKILEEHPADSYEGGYAQLRLSYVYSQLGDFDRTESILKKIVNGQPSNETWGRRIWATANNDLAYQWAERNVKLNESLSMVTKALEIEPNNSSYLDTQGWILFKLGRYQEAVTALKASIEYEESMNDPVPFEHLGDAYLMLGDFAKAKENWTIAKAYYEKSKTRDKKREKVQELTRKLQQHQPAGK